MKRWLVRPAAFLAVVIAGCGGGEVATLAGLPVYPGAVETKVGQTRVAAVYAKDLAEGAATRGGTTEQRSYRLPEGIRWEQVKAFYGEKLEAASWTSGVGAETVPGMVGRFLAMTANQGNEFVRLDMWSKGNQTLTIVMVNPSRDRQGELIRSLSTR